MKKIIHYFMIGVYLLVITACSGNKNMKNISQIEYYAGSGPVSPEFQWQEKIIITAHEITFTRSGDGPDTLINTGTWTIPVNKSEIDELFTTLEAVDISTIKRVAFEDPMDGGGYESYTISYANNKTFSISNDTEGETENSDLIIDPVQAFFQQLDFPEEAIERELLK